MITNREDAAWYDKNSDIDLLASPRMEKVENLLTICIPSNRDLNTSKRAILMAHAFSRITDCAVVLSDNSECRLKKEFLKRLASPRFHIVQGASNEANNWMTAFEGATSEYIWFMCDDDFVIPLGEEVLIDLKKGVRCDDIVGFRPTTFNIVKGGESTRVQRFAIEAYSPAERVVEYLRANGGNNLTLYSIWKRKALKEIFATTAQHPVTIQGRTAGYTDWSFVIGLVSSGRIPAINALGYGYSNDNWATSSTIAESNSAIYRRAGIPDSAESIRGLLLAADSIATICGRHSVADNQEKRDAADVLISLELERFSGSLLASLEQDRQLSPVTIATAKILAAGLNSFEERVERLIAVIDLWIPGFGASYARYFSEVIDPDCYRHRGLTNVQQMGRVA